MYVKCGFSCAAQGIEALVGIDTSTRSQAEIDIMGEQYKIF